MHLASPLQYGRTWITCHFMLAIEKSCGGLKRSGHGKDPKRLALPRS